MAKLCGLFILFAFAVVARGIRIDPPKLERVGKYFADNSQARITVDDVVCRKGNGLYPHPTDCTQYLACYEGTSKVRTCPEGFKFDSRRHCTPDTDADCGTPRATRINIHSADLTCPEQYGQFPYPGDCRKYITCDNWNPTSWMCNGEQVYEQGVGCWDGGVCHDSESQQAKTTLTCPEQYGQFPYPGDCHKYITCDNWNPTSWLCNGEQVYEQGVGCWDGGVCRDSQPQQFRISAESVKCPSSYGYFPFFEDCHKFLVCVDGVPTLHFCPEGTVYKDHVGCVEGNVCPPRQAGSEDSRATCRKPNALYPHERCDRYYKCVASRPYIKECTRGTAFDPKKEKCTKAMFDKCIMKNDLQDLLRA
ncbi:hypothetical protein JTE90_002086 [Oedothorax gibbosus]|uniref:Chitin-binding type-2 domain-containing protein n=1 Tax=Oedothorax gibbosus TaxID=931172 RepID=A0AAV6UE96_9ARAC|nr:hypothetical protein JTE90_002086 [Oedothorax gibbosus]